MTELGLRERKKLETRQRITAAALDLFVARGFEAVPVIAIAEAAEVSPATVFNYFPTKEDLIYDGMASFHADLIAAVRVRPEGTTVAAAYRDYVLQRRGLLASNDPHGLELIARVARVIRESPSLQARERLESDRAIAALADLIADELSAAPGDLRPFVHASALVSVSRAMSRTVQDGAIAGHSAPKVARQVMAAGTAAFDSLERGPS